MPGFAIIVNTLNGFMKGVFGQIDMGEQANPWVNNVTGLLYGLFFGIMSFFNTEK